MAERHSELLLVSNIGSRGTFHGVVNRECMKMNYKESGRVLTMKTNG